MAPTWKCVSGDKLSQVNVDPQRAQKPRHLPGDEPD
jgi:hypothetical protein